jgi:glucose/arabinose dehydrogenase
MKSHSFLNKISYLLVILPALLLTSGPNRYPIQQNNDEGQTPAIEFDLLTETSGWVLLDSELFWTSDSGQSWNEINPSIPADVVVQDVEFIDADTGWILWMTVSSAGSSSFTIAHTNDHGAHWTTTTPAFFEEGEISAYAEMAEMGWIDPQRGWLAVKQSSSSNFSLGTLFTTSDGGNTWKRTMLPGADHVTFSDPQTGWAIGGSTGDQVYITQDGGSTWQSVRPDVGSSSSAVAYKPFYKDGQGILVMTSLDMEGGSTLYAFEISSGSWQLIDQLSLSGQPGLVGLSIVDARNFVATIPGTASIERMREGVLETLTNQDGLSASITYLDMVTLDVGWAKSVDSKCETSSSPDNEPVSVSCTSHIRMLRTEDGGLTWKDIQLPSALSATALSDSVEVIGSMSVGALAASGNTDTFIGQGFDKCEIPSLAQLQTWWDNSPYKMVNLYIGGSNRSCLNSSLTSLYLGQLRQQGWRFFPTWVGPQAPCTGYSTRISSDVTIAYSQGINEANLAVERLAQLGLTYPDKTGSVIYYDIENYGTNTACRDAVKSFMNGWVSQLHTRGNLAGVYGSTLCNTGLSDLSTIANPPDGIWPARWYHGLGQGYYDPTATVWDLGTCLPNTAWANHQRIRQYEGDHNETWGNLTLAVDSNVLDGVVAVPFPDPAKISFQEIVAGLNSPVLITNAGDGSGRMFVVERSGKIRIIKNGVLLATPFLDIQSIVKSTNSEQGLLALAFHPSYETNGKFYVAYTSPRSGDTSGSVLILRQYSVSAGNPDLANSASGVNILTVDHPTNSNHNGGTLAFGADGYLYWSIGDGGGAGDPGNNAQRLTTHLGKILRINVNSGSPYAIPATNPFFNSSDPAIKKEIWAYGLRNTWRMSFDRSTHDLYIGDVGQSVREEIDFQPSNSTGGENYGWRVMEGSLCYNPSSGCNQSGKVLPVTEYDHSLGCSVTGGYVYRGQSFPTLYGYYLYGDFCSGRIFGIHKNSPAGWSAPIQLADTAFSITTFGEDEQGELYLADYSTGKIYKIQYAEPFVTISGNAGVSNVTLSYSDGASKTVKSQSTGGYSLTVPNNWTGTVTPSHPCFTFNPTSLSYSNVTTSQTGQNYTAALKAGCANVNVTVGGDAVGRHGLPPGGFEAATYPGVANGPVKVTGSAPVFTSQRAIYGNSFNELTGFPADQLTTDYWFTYYDDVNMSTWLMIGNADPIQSAHVEVYLGNGSTPIRTFDLDHGESVLPKLGVVGGPLRVVSTNGVKIFTSQRAAYLGSFNELMGFPADQLTTDYWFTYYDDINMATWLMIGNADPLQTAHVEVYLGNDSTPIKTYDLAHGEGVLPKLGVVGGPLRVVSTNGVPIFTSQRAAYGNSFNELMGFPADQLTTDYWFTYYDDVNMSTWLMIGNADPVQTAHVEVYLGNDSTPIKTYDLDHGESVLPKLDVAGGPLRVVSTNGVEIFTSERVAYGSSFNELMGFPADQLTTDYWFTYYDDVNMATWLMIGRP